MLRGRCRSRQAVSPCSRRRPRIRGRWCTTAAVAATFAGCDASRPKPASCVACTGVAAAIGLDRRAGIFRGAGELKLDFGNGNFCGGQLNRAPARLEIAARVHAENIGAVQEDRAACTGRRDRSWRRPSFGRRPRPSHRRQGCCCPSSTRPSMLPAGNALRLERASLAGVCAYAAGAPSTNVAIAAAGIHRVIIPRPTGRPEGRRYGPTTR